MSNSLPLETSNGKGDCTPALFPLEVWRAMMIARVLLPTARPCMFVQHGACAYASSHALWPWINSALYTRAKVLPSGPHMGVRPAPLLAITSASVMCRVFDKQSIKRSDFWLQGCHADPSLCRIWQPSGDLWIMRVSRPSHKSAP